MIKHKRFKKMKQIKKIVLGNGYNNLTIKQLKRLIKDYDYSECGIQFINNFLVIDFLYF